MIAAILIGYVFRVKDSQKTVELILNILTVVTMLFMSIMGFIASFQRYQVGYMTQTIRQYCNSVDILDICFGDGP